MQTFILTATMVGADGYYKGTSQPWAQTTIDLRTNVKFHGSLTVYAVISNGFSIMCDVDLIITNQPVEG